MVRRGTPYATDPLVFEARLLFRSCLAKELRKAGLEIPPETCDLILPDDLTESLRPVGQRLTEISDELQHRHGSELQKMTASLRTDQVYSQTTLRRVGAELFRSGVNWGRLVAFFAFASRMALEGRNKGYENAEDDVTLWTCQVVSTEVVPWLKHQRGGWNGLVKHFGPPNKLRNSSERQRRARQWTAVTIGLIASIGAFALCLLSS